MKNRVGIHGLSILVSLSFSSCSSFYKGAFQTKNFKSTDVPGQCTVSFDYFDGTQLFDLKLPQSGPYYFKYSTEVKTGKLHLALKTSSKTLLSKDLQGSALDSIRVDSPGDGKVQVIIDASKAAGKVDLTYGTMTPWNGRI
jgi:hypothetical protein